MNFTASQIVERPHKLFFIIAMTLAVLMFTLPVLSRDPPPLHLKVVLGQEFTLHIGETASLKNGALTITVTGFVNSPCPEGTSCYWSGQAVKYTLVYDKKTYERWSVSLPLENMPYQIEVLRTDYTTEAVFVIKRRA